VDVRITVDDAGGPDELRDLRGWLGHEPELRGRITAVEPPAQPGSLGPVLEALLVAVAPGGVAVALVTSIVSWIRQRHSDLAVQITYADGTKIKIDAKRVRGLTGADLHAEIAQLTSTVWPEE
jgi:Effector Associated Constant Component 1